MKKTSKEFNKNILNNYNILEPSNKNPLINKNQINKRTNYSLDNHNNTKLKPDKNKKEFNNNLNNNQSNDDPRLMLTMRQLNIESALPKLKDNKITFNDLLLLSRKDLIDLGLSMIERNRILNFSLKFLKYGKYYTIDEINSFFDENKNLYGKPISNGVPNNSNKNINNDNQGNCSQRNNVKDNNKENKLLYNPNEFENNNNFNNEKDSQQDNEFCNIFPGSISKSRTNTSSKNNINYASNGVDFFLKYQELTQEIDNYLNKYNEYKQSWLDSRKKYDNLMNSYLFKGKQAENNKNNKTKKYPSQYKTNKNKTNIDEESYKKLKILKERKEELKIQLDRIKDRSNHKKMIIKYLDENE